MLRVGTNLSLRRMDAGDLSRCNHRLPLMANGHWGSRAGQEGYPERMRYCLGGMEQWGCHPSEPMHSKNLGWNSHGCHHQEVLGKAIAWEGHGVLPGKGALWKLPELWN